MPIELSVQQRLDRLEQLPISDFVRESYWRYGKTQNTALLLYEKNTCNHGRVEVLAMTDAPQRIKATKWIVKILLAEFRDRGPEIRESTALRFYGATAEEALENAEFELGMSRLSELAGNT